MMNNQINQLTKTASAIPKAYLEPDEIQKIIDTADNLRDRLLVSMLFQLGCRVSEVLAISVSDIDLEGGTVIIKHLKSRIKLKCPNCHASIGLTTVYCPRCGSKVGAALKETQQNRRQRVLPLNSELTALLRQYIKRGGPVNKNGKLFLFGINRHRAWQIVTELAKEVGLPSIINTETGKVHNVSPHRLRDAFAVHAVKHDDTGDGLRMLQEHLGHQSFDTTARYRKVAGEEHRRWYDALWRQK